jgi:neutral ceramidase
MMINAKAGWAEVDITPPLGLPMGGRGPRYAPGTEVLDPLVAQALVLEDRAGNRTLWISLDLIGLSYARSAALRYELAAITGIPYNAIVLNFAHTHSGPMVNFEKYPGYLEEPAAPGNFRSGYQPAQAVRYWRYCTGTKS